MKTVLVLIDIQNDYFEQGSMALVGSAAAAQNAKLLLDAFRADGLPVVHIQHIASRPTATFFLPNTPGAAIHQTVKPVESETVIVKHYPNSFRETELLNHLTDMSATELVVCGMMTHMCVDATVRAAKDLGFAITLIGDACATKDLQIEGKTVRAEEVHAAFLAALSYFYATVTTTAGYIDGLKLK